ncbi:MAG: ATP-grasp domain-containing protein [Acidobacteria bacterium]|uniref:ATP-grasp domain-containing protein n=1 Tax=Candidatus Polarisedimenticola svalbardensis TaxID=2886004 RepID=A0A8J7CDZ2_9BACT|nr:ATP-grasp domain-containing protein [Candidatus Polarisedimenticola svalbardensis]
MPAVVFVAPFFLETTLRFLKATALLPGVRLGLISQDPVSRLPESIRSRLTAVEVLPDALDPEMIAGAVRRLAGSLGPIHRLIGALEQLQVPLGQVRDLLDIDGMKAPAARKFRDKALMKETLQAAGVPCARHVLAGSREQIREFLERTGYPVVVKPIDGAGGKDTHRVEDSDGLERALAVTEPTPERPVLMEEFVQGQEHSFDCVSIHGRQVWHSLSHYYPGPLEVMENPWIQWCVMIPREVDDARYDDIRQVASQALDALGVGTALSHMEWFRRQDGSIAVSEVGARPPGAQFTTLISYANEIDLYGAWAELMVYDRFRPPERKFAAGAAYLRGQGEGPIRRILGLDRIREEIGELVVEARLPEPGSRRSGSYEGDGYIILRHPSSKVVRQALGRVVETVRLEC